MARLPKKPRLQPDDFPKVEWIDKLLGPLNGFIDDTIGALNKSLTFKENLAGEALPVIIEGTYPIDVRWTNKEKPTSAWIGKIRETSGPHTTLTTALFLDWEFSDSGAFRINNIAGLTIPPGTKFAATILVLVG